MKQYFIWLKLNQPKNKACEAVQEFAQQYDNCLMDAPELDKFQAALDKRIDEVNHEFKRCTDIHKSWRGKTWEGGYETMITVDAGVYFTYREVKRYETTNK